MGTEYPFNISFRGEHDILGGLLNFDSVKVIEKTKILQWDLVFFRELEFFSNDLENLFRNIFGRTGQSKVIYLT